MLFHLILYASGMTGKRKGLSFLKTFLLITNQHATMGGVLRYFSTLRLLRPTLGFACTLVCFNPTLFKKKYGGTPYAGFQSKTLQHNIQVSRTAL